MKRTKKTLAGIVAVSLALSMMPMSVTAVNETGTAATTSAVEVNYSNAVTKAYDLTKPYNGIVTTASFDPELPYFAEYSNNGKLNKKYVTGVLLHNDTKGLAIDMQGIQIPNFADNYTSLSESRRRGLDICYDVQEITVTLGSGDSQLTYTISNKTDSDYYDRVFAEDYSNLDTNGKAMDALARKGKTKVVIPLSVMTGSLKRVNALTSKDNSNIAVSDGFTDDNRYAQGGYKISVKFAVKTMNNFDATTVRTWNTRIEEATYDAGTFGLTLTQ